MKEALAEPKAGESTLPLAAFDKNTSYDLKAVEHAKPAIPEIK